LQARVMRKPIRMPNLRKVAVSGLQLLSRNTGRDAQEFIALGELISHKVSSGQDFGESRQSFKLIVQFLGARNGNAQVVQGNHQADREYQASDGGL